MQSMVTIQKNILMINSTAQESKKNKRKKILGSLNLIFQKKMNDSIFIEEKPKFLRLLLSVLCV